MLQSRSIFLAGYFLWIGFSFTFTQPAFAEVKGSVQSVGKGKVVMMQQMSDISNAIDFAAASLPPDDAMCLRNTSSSIAAILTKRGVPGSTTVECQNSYLLINTFEQKYVLAKSGKVSSLSLAAWSILIPSAIAQTVTNSIVVMVVVAVAKAAVDTLTEEGKEEEDKGGKWVADTYGGGGGSNVNPNPQP